MDEDPIVLVPYDPAWLSRFEEAAAAYLTLKRDLAPRFGNRRAEYAEAKTEFVKGILARISG